MEQSTSKTPPLPQGRALWIIIVLLLASNLLASFMQSIMNIALDQVASEFSIRLSEANWVVLGYAIVTGAVITMAASMLKRFGLRKVMFIGYIAALVGSVLGFFATCFPVMVAARLIQAIATGLYFPVVNEALLTLSPKGKAGVLLSVNSGVIGAGLAFAPLLSGLVITYWGLRVLFLIPALFALVLFFVALFALQDIYAREKRRIDVASVILSFAGLGLFMFGLNEISHALVSSLVTMLIGIVVITLFVWRQNKIQTPLLDLRPLKNKTFTIGELLIVFSYMGSMYLSLLTPLYLEGTQGTTPFEAGCFLALPILCYALLCFVSGRILGKHGVSPLVPVGFLVMISGFVVVYFTSSHNYLIPFLIGTGIAYGGDGLYYPSVKSVNLEVLPPELSSNGSSIHSTLVQIAGSISSALFVGLMSEEVHQLMASGASKAAAYTSGFSHTLVLIIGVMVVAFFVSLLYVRLVRKWLKQHK